MQSNLVDTLAASVTDEIVDKDINMSANLIFNTGRNLGAKVSHWTNKGANYESRLSSEVEDTCTTE
jgi:hypothetical protein